MLGRLAKRRFVRSVVAVDFVAALALCVFGLVAMYNGVLATLALGLVSLELKTIGFE